MAARGLRHRAASRRRAFTRQGAVIVRNRRARRRENRRDRGDRQPEVRDETDVDGAAVTGRTDADDRHRHTFDPDRAADRRTGSARNSLVHDLMPEDGDERRAGLLLGLVEPAAERRPQSQDVEIRRRRELDDAHCGRRRRGGSGRRSGCWSAIVAVEDVRVLRHFQVRGVRGDDERPTRRGRSDRC